MTSAEFAEAQAFEQLEPDPAEWTMQLMAQLLTLMANVHRDDKKRPRPYEVSDFLPQVAMTDAQAEAEQATEQNWNDVLADMRARHKASKPN